MKTVLITGATGDIGQAIVRAFKGWNIIIQYNKNEETAKKLQKEVGGITVKCDVTDFDSVENMFEIARKNFGKVDVLINNAGVQLIKMLADTSVSEWKTVIDTDLTSVFNTTKCALKDMMYSGGKIINISSVVGVSGNAGQTNYSASKAGMIGLAKSIAKEMGPRGIRANCIAPGFIITEMTAALPESVREAWNQQIPLRRGGTPEDVAKVALFLASDLSSYVSGQVIHCCGAMNC